MAFGFFGIPLRPLPWRLHEIQNICIDTTFRTKKIMRRIGLLITTTLLTSALLAGMAPAAQAAAVSSDTKFGLAELPCDGVEYPVLTSVNNYTESAGTPVRLVSGASNTLTTTETRSSTNQIQNSYTNSFKLNLSLSPKFGNSLSGGAGIDYTYTQNETYTNGSTVTFTQSNAIKLTPKSDGLVAEPTFYKVQGWGAYWSCDVNTKQKSKLTADDAVRVDIAEATGWALTQNGRPATKNDYTNN